MAKKDKGVAAANGAQHKDKNDLATLVSKLNAEMGDNTVMTGNVQIKNVDFISTGIAVLDAAAGGGIPRGRIAELFGLESSGKTTTALEIVASCQRTFFQKEKRNGVCAFIDAEHSLDPVWARNVGVDMKKVLLTQPDHGEQIFDIIEKMAISGLVDLAIVDSVASIIPKSELDGSIEDNPIGAQARLMSQGLRRINGPLQKSSMSVVFINQIRHKIGIKFGSPETTPGGWGLRFYSSIRIDLRRGATKDSDGGYGGNPEEKKEFNRVRAKIVKNKVAPPFQSCEYQIHFGHVPEGSDKPVYGVDKIGSLFDAGLLYDVIKQQSSFFYHKGQKLGNGRAKSLVSLRQLGPDAAEALRQEIVNAARPQENVDMADVPDDELDAAITEEDLSAPIEG